MSAETNQQAELSTYKREEIGRENTSKQELSRNYSSLGTITCPDDELPGSTAPILLHQTSRYPAQRGVVWGRLVPPPLWTLGLIPEALPWWCWWWWWWWWRNGDAQPLLYDLVYSVPVVLIVRRTHAGWSFLLR